MIRNLILLGVYLKTSIVLWLVLFILGVATRLDMAIPNFALVGAITFFASQKLILKKSSVSLVLAILLVSDAILGFYPGVEWVYLGYGFYILGGAWTQKSSYFKQIATLALASGGFFILSNLGVWLSTELYSANLAGLMNCYWMALPFYRMTWVSDFVGFGVLGLGYQAYLALSRHPVWVK